MQSSRKDSHRNSVQNGPVDRFTALTVTIFVNFSVFVSRGDFQYGCEPNQNRRNRNRRNRQNCLNRTAANRLNRANRTNRNAWKRANLKPKRNGASLSKRQLSAIFCRLWKAPFQQISAPSIRPGPGARLPYFQDSGRSLNKILPFIFYCLFLL